MTEPRVAWTWTPSAPLDRVVSAEFRGGVLAVLSRGPSRADSAALALDPATGRTLWSHRVPGLVAGLGGTEEVIAVLDDERGLHGLRPGDGARLWRRQGVIGPGRPVEGPRHRAVLTVGKAAPGRELFTVTREWTRTFDSIDGQSEEVSNEIAVLDARGRTRDQRSAVAYYDDSWTRPVPEFSVPSRRIVARDATDGSVRWRSRRWPGSEQVHICVDRQAALVIGVNERGIRAYDIATGLLRWRRPGVKSRPGTGFSFLYDAVVTDGILCVQADGLLAAFRAATGVRVWRRETARWRHEIVAGGDVLYVLHPSGTNLRAIAASDGSQLWCHTPAPRDVRDGERARREVHRVLAVRDGLVYVTYGDEIRALEAPDGAVRAPRDTTGAEVFDETPQEAGELAAPVPRFGRRFLLGLEREHRVHDFGDGSFRVVRVRGREIAVAEYGSRFYDEGVPVRLAVDLRTGAFQHWHDNGVESRSRPPLALGGLVPPWDPVRRWLSAAPTPAPVEVTIRTRAQLARFSAAMIARTDLPGPAPAPALKASPLLALTSPRARRLIRAHPPETLPYETLFAHQTHAPAHIGADPHAERGEG